MSGFAESSQVEIEPVSYDSLPGFLNLMEFGGMVKIQGKRLENTVEIGVSEARFLANIPRIGIPYKWLDMIKTTPIPSDEKRAFIDDLQRKGLVEKRKTRYYVSDAALNAQYTVTQIVMPRAVF